MRAVLLILALVPMIAVAAGVQVDDPWIAEPPPGAPVAGGFMVLKNSTDEPRQLVDVSSDAFGKIEMHRSFHENGMARMEAQDSIPIPANGSTALEHGSYHLMLMQAKQPLRAGAEVPLVLEFDDGSRVEVVAPVRKLGHMAH